jgi:glutathione-independent formaldehyde dehydrogenase
LGRVVADIWPTGWHGVELSVVQAGESVVIYGAGPVGRMSAVMACNATSVDRQVRQRAPVPVLILAFLHIDVRANET